MKKDFEYWFHQQHLLGYPFDIGGFNDQPAHRNPYFVGDSTLRTVPFCPVPQLKPLNTNGPNVSSNWCDGTPYPPHKAYTPVRNSATKELPLTGPTTGIAPGQKRSFVFDQSGDKTTLIFSSGVKTAVQHGTPLTPILPTGFNLNKEPLPDSENHLTSITKDEYGDNRLGKDEMREDTEELNALFYSDNDSYFLEDDEEASTGHSPSTISDNGVGDSDEETGEEVDSSFGLCKRRKVFNGAFDVASGICSAKKTNAFSDLEDHAESSCGNRNEQISVGNIGSLSGEKRSRREKIHETNLKDHAESSCGNRNEQIIMGNIGSLSVEKRSRREKIRETVRVLQNNIPGVKGNDAIVVIDEAINYLKSLKVKAMALGLDML